MTHDDKLISQAPYCALNKCLILLVQRDDPHRPPLKKRKKHPSKVQGEGAEKVGKLVISVVKMAPAINHH